MDIWLEQEEIRACRGQAIETEMEWPQMKIKAQSIRVLLTLDGKAEYIITSKDRPTEEINDLMDKELSVEIKPYRKRRSLDANALLWKMCDEIAKVIRSSKDEVYLTMLERYGVFTHVIVKPEAAERIKQEWRAVRELGEVTVNGKTGIQLQCYYGSHLYDTKEFSVLLDGVISEAKELGVEVISEQEKNLLMQEWGK